MDYYDLDVLIKWQVKISRCSIIYTYSDIIHMIKVKV